MPEHRGSREHDERRYPQRPMGPAKRYHVTTFGCQMNEHDSERISGLLTSIGLREVSRAEEAGLLVYNTCSIREKADTRLLGHLGEARRLKREDPRRLVVVAGCLAQSRRNAFFLEHPHVDVLVGPQSLHELPLLLEERLATGGQTAAFQDTTCLLYTSDAADE